MPQAGRSPRGALLSSSAGRQILFAALYMSEGAPIGYLWWALPTRLRIEGVPLEEITSLTAILVLPWLLKFLWAPLVDTVRTRRWSLRSWIFSMQFLMGATLLPLLFIDLQTGRGILLPLLLLHAVAAATQDTAIDALAIAHVPENERGRTNGAMQVGMLTGRAVFGGGALIVASWLGQGGTVLLLIACIYSSSLLLFVSPPELPGVGAPQGSIPARAQDVLRRLRLIARRRSTWLGLLFAGIGGAAYEGAGAVAGPYLVDRGFASTDIGAFFAFFSVAGMIAGSVAGGIVADRMGKRKAVLLFLLLVVLAVWALAAVDVGFPEGGGGWTFACLTAVYLCIGLFTAASYALFMDLTEPGLGATQFSAFMGGTNACESWSALAMGRLVPWLGYPAGFFLMGLPSLLAAPLILLLPSSAQGPLPEGGEQGSGHLAQRNGVDPAEGVT